MNLYDKASLILTANAYKSGKLYALKPTNGSGDFTFARASTAMRRNSAGNWESIANNIPRLQYSVGGGCPCILIEAQRTNIVLACNNAFYDGSVTSATSSELTNIDGINFRVMTASAVNDNIYTNILALSSNPTGVMCFSVFFKKGNCTKVQLIDQHTTGVQVTVDLTNGSIISNTSGLKCGVINDGNDIYRVYIVQDYTSIGYRFDIYAKEVGTLYYSTAQMEEGTYPSSPIITSGSSVTRIADVYDATGIDGLIGQSDGVVSWEGLVYDNTEVLRVRLNGGSIGANSIVFVTSSGTLIAYVTFGGTTITLSTSITYSSYNKIALVYSDTSCGLYLNGALVASTPTAIVFTTSLDYLELRTNGQYYQSPGTTETGLVLLCPAKLSNSELVALTTL